MKKWTAMILVLAMLILTAGSLCFTEGGVNAASTPSILRVKLSTIGTVKSKDFKVQGQYSLPDGRLLTAGSTYTACLSDGKAAIKDSAGKVVYTSDSGYVILKKVDNSYKGMQMDNPRYGSRMYLGDMYFIKSGTGIYLINHIDIETYLVGVVFGEIGNSSHIEALKAQAVAARSYAVSLMKSAQTPTTYDILDSSSNQVYPGYNATWTKCIQAVRETAGQVLTYNGKVVGGYYSASNGGQTRSSENAWGSAPLAYLQINDDIYDYNSSGVNRKLYLPRTITNKDVYSTLDARIEAMMKPELQIALYSLGYSTNPDNFSILGVNDLSVHTRRFPDEKSRSYVFLRITARLLAYKGDQNLHAAPTGETVEYMRTANAKRTLGVYSGPSSSYDVLKTLWSGARVQVLDKSKSYYKVKTADGTVGYINSANLSDSVVISPNTGKMMVQQDEQEEFLYKGTIVNCNISVNMRSGPGTAFSIIGSLAKGLELDVLGQIGGWYHIRTAAGAVGYVSGEYLKVEKVSQAAEPAAAAETVVSTEGGELLATGTAEPDGTAEATDAVTAEPTEEPTEEPTQEPTEEPTQEPSQEPTATPQPVEVLPEEITVTVDVFIDDIRDYSLAQGTSLKNQIIYYAESYTDYFIFSMRGNGHGVGFSQQGARMRALDGHTYQQILLFYYNNTVIKIADYEVINPNEQTTPDPTRWYGTVSLSDPSTALNVRDEASVDGALIGQLWHEARVEILEQAGEWYKIKTDHLEGYVMGKYIDAWENPNTPEPSVTPEETGTSPSPSDEETSEPTSTVSETPAITETPTETPTATPTPEIKQVATVVNVNTAVNMRSGASTSTALIGTVAKGTKCEVLGKSGDWYQVKTPQGKIGYIRGDYLKVESVTVTPTPTPTPTATPTVTPTPTPTATPTPETKQVATVVNVNTAVNMRSGPSTSTALIGTVAKGTKCEVLGKSGDWYQVKTPQGKIGYIRGDYLKVETVTVKTATVYNAGTGLNFRTGAGTDYHSIRKLPNGTVVTVLEENGKWFKIRIEDGTVGYAYASYLRLNA